MLRPDYIESTHLRASRMESLLYYKESYKAGGAELDIPPRLPFVGHVTHGLINSPL